jgi:hypothetical protein
MKVLTELTLLDSPASAAERTEPSCEMALAAWAEAADSSFDVTEPPPPTTALIRLDRAFMTDWNP